MFSVEILLMEKDLLGAEGENKGVKVANGSRISNSNYGNYVICYLRKIRIAGPGADFWLAPIK